MDTMLDYKFQQFERLQMAAAMSRISPLWSVRAAAHDYIDMRRMHDFTLEHLVHFGEVLNRCVLHSNTTAARARS